MVSPLKRLGILILPVPILITAVLTSMGLGLYLAALNIKYRDVRYAVPFFIQTMMYITPVIYLPACSVSTRFCRRLCCG